MASSRRKQKLTDDDHHDDEELAKKPRRIGKSEVATFTASKASASSSDRAAASTTADTIRARDYEHKMKAMAASVAAPTLPPVPRTADLLVHTVMWHETVRSEPDEEELEAEGDDPEDEEEGPEEVTDEELEPYAEGAEREAKRVEFEARNEAKVAITNAARVKQAEENKRNGVKKYKLRGGNGDGVQVYGARPQLIPDVLRDSLNRQFDVLANHPSKDYHPGSNDKVLNLVHPSMYPFVAGRSTPVDSDAKVFVDGVIKELSKKTKRNAGLLPPKKKKGKNGKKTNKKKKDSDDDEEEEDDVKEKEDEEEEKGEGDMDANDDDEEKPKKKIGIKSNDDLKADDEEEEEDSSESEKEKDYDSDGRAPHVDGIIGHSETLGRKYEDSMYQWMPAEFSIDATNGDVTITSAINSLSRDTFPLLYRDIAQVFQRMLPMFENVIQVAKPVRYGRQPEVKKVEHPLWGKSVQVIVKAATYVLKAGESDYNGSWHVEGMSHERIIASGIFYYHTDTNISGEGLQFRRVLTHGETMELESDGSSVSVTRDMGTIPTPHAHCVVFHNQYQHCVAPLANKTDRDGVRKILCFFLVDPEYRTVSTAHIGNQQWDLYHDKIVSSFSDTKTTTSSDAAAAPVVVFPSVLIDLICDYARHGFTHDEALQVRRELMIERKFFVDEHNEAWERSYSLCEH